MAKYRGQHNGVTRGKYEKALLYYEPANEDETRALERKIRVDLGKLGESVLGCCDDPHREHYNWGFYHLAGATVGISVLYKPMKDWFEPYMLPYTGPNHYVQLKLVSNDGLEDVIRKITDKYPMLQPRDIENERP
ncbi:MAG: hypothetical protein AB1611_12825 [bacterium]